MNDTAVKLFVEQIRESRPIDELIKIENFKIGNKYTGYLYAYHTDVGVHIDTGVSSGKPCFKDLENYSDMYCNHTLHEYLYQSAVDDTDITLESRVEELLQKTLAQLIILEPVQKECMKNNKKSIL
ncbi:MAG: hypothetical protein RR806_07860 [Oscillospiraceae bacterium]